MTIILYEWILIGMQWTGDVMTRAKFSRLSEALNSEHPPTSATKSEASWQEDNFVMSITWGATPKMVMLDSEAHAKSQT